MNGIVGGCEEDFSQQIKADPEDGLSAAVPPSVGWPGAVKMASSRRYSQWQRSAMADAIALLGMWKHAPAQS
jgi:hypothetical protein